MLAASPGCAARCDHGKVLIAPRDSYPGTRDMAPAPGALASGFRRRPPSRGVRKSARGNSAGLSVSCWPCRLGSLFAQAGQTLVLHSSLAACPFGSGSHRRVSWCVPLRAHDSSRRVISSLTTGRILARNLTIFCRARCTFRARHSVLGVKRARPIPDQR